MAKIFYSLYDYYIIITAKIMRRTPFTQMNNDIAMATCQCNHHPLEPTHLAPEYDQYHFNQRSNIQTCFLHQKRFDIKDAPN